MAPQTKLKNYLSDMAKKKNTSLVPEEVLVNKIYLIRYQKVMLDRDLAELYGVETKRLKEQVRRNKDRFPEDFMFELSKEELEDWRSQFATSNKERMGMRVPPFAFTEHGVLMLSSILNSKKAINVNIQIMRVFTKMKEVLSSHKEMLERMDKFENTLEGQGHEIQVLFEYIKKLMEEKESRIKQATRKSIGFKKK